MPLKILMQLTWARYSPCYALCTYKSDLAMEVLALRLQLAVLKRKVLRSRLDEVDRAFCCTIKEHFASWVDALIIVKPETVIQLAIRSRPAQGSTARGSSDCVE